MNTRHLDFWIKQTRLGFISTAVVHDLRMNLSHILQEGRDGSAIILRQSLVGDQKAQRESTLFAIFCLKAMRCFFPMRR